MHVIRKRGVRMHAFRHMFEPAACTYLLHTPLCRPCSTWTGVQRHHSASFSMQSSHPLHLIHTMLSGRSHILPVHPYNCIFALQVYSGGSSVGCASGTQRDMKITFACNQAYSKDTIVSRVLTAPCSYETRVEASRLW